MNKSKNTLSWIVVALLVVVAIAVVVVAMCSSEKINPSSDRDTVTAGNTTNNDDTTQDVPDESQSNTDTSDEPDDAQTSELSQSEVLWGEEKETNTLNTPSFSLIYPTEWDDIFEVSETSTDDLYSVSFFAKGAYAGVRIFSVYFGETTDSDAYLLGSVLSNDGERINVYHSVNMAFDDYNDEQIAELSQLQSYINDILIQIQHHSSFERI